MNCCCSTAPSCANVPLNTAMISTQSRPIPSLPTNAFHRPSEFTQDLCQRHRTSLQSEQHEFCHPNALAATENRDDFHYHRMLLNSSCSIACPGCRWAADPPDKVHAPEQDFNQAKNANVELTCGDDIPIATIVHRAAQCKLAGALRIKLSAPPALFNQPQAIQQLRQAGVYLFKTFLPGDGTSGPEEYEDMLQGFQKIRHHRFRSPTANYPCTRKSA